MAEKRYKEKEPTKMWWFIILSQLNHLLVHSFIHSFVCSNHLYLIWNMIKENLFSIQVKFCRVNWIEWTQFLNRVLAKPTQFYCIIIIWNGCKKTQQMDLWWWCYCYYPFVIFGSFIHRFVLLFDFKQSQRAFELIEIIIKKIVAEESNLEWDRASEWVLGCSGMEWSL